jgi:hypothetical protein
VIYVKGLIACYLIATLWEFAVSLRKDGAGDVCAEILETLILIAFIYGVGSVVQWAGL